MCNNEHICGCGACEAFLQFPHLTSRTGFWASPSAVCMKPTLGRTKVVECNQSASNTGIRWWLCVLTLPNTIVATQHCTAPTMPYRLCHTCIVVGLYTGPLVCDLPPLHKRLRMISEVAMICLSIHDHVSRSTTTDIRKISVLYACHASVIKSSANETKPVDCGAD